SARRGPNRVPLFQSLGVSDSGNRQVWEQRPECDYRPGHSDCGPCFDANTAAFRFGASPISHRLLQRVQSHAPCGAPNDAELCGLVRFWRAVRSPISKNHPTWIKIFMVKNFLAIPLALLLVAQKPVKKPDVHPDFQFGSYPWSRNAEMLM